MLAKTLMARANEIMEDYAKIEYVSDRDAKHWVNEVYKIIGGKNVSKYLRDNYDTFCAITTGRQPLLNYPGEPGDITEFIQCVGKNADQNYFKQPTTYEYKNAFAHEQRGISWDEMVRRDFMRMIADINWLYNKQVFEFSDELLSSLLSGVEFVRLGDLEDKEEVRSSVPIELKDKITLTQVKFYLDRINLLPFRNFVLDVSSNSIFQKTEIRAIQVTPIFVEANKRAIIHVECIGEDGALKIFFSYNIDYVKRPDILMEEFGCKYVQVLLFASPSIIDILNGDATFEGPILDDPQTIEIFNNVLGAVVTQVINYLGSDGTDIRVSSDTKNTFKPHKEGSRIKNSYKEFQKWECGFVYADSVKKYRALKESVSHQEGGTRSPVRPHVRRAHWHHYWIGPRNNQRLIRKWIPETGVNMDFHSDLILTIHREGK